MFISVTTMLDWLKERSRFLDKFLISVFSFLEFNYNKHIQSVHINFELAQNFAFLNSWPWCGIQLWLLCLKQIKHNDIIWEIFPSAPFKSDVFYFPQKRFQQWLVIHKSLGQKCKTFYSTLSTKSRYLKLSIFYLFT